MAETSSSPTLKVLIFSASRRAGSLNTQLAALAAKVAAAHGATVDLASMHDSDVPVYDGDLEVKTGIPPGAQALQFLAVARQCGQALGIAGIAFVGDVVGAARKAVDGTHRRAQPARQQQRSDGKVFIMIHGHGRNDIPSGPAGLLRRHGQGGHGMAFQRG